MRLFQVISVTAGLSLAGCVLDGTAPRTVEAAEALFDIGTFKAGPASKQDLRLKLGPPCAIRSLDGKREVWVYVKTRGLDVSIFGADMATDYVAEYTFDPNGLLVEATYQAVPAGSDAPS